MRATDYLFRERIYRGTATPPDYLEDLSRNNNDCGFKAAGAPDWVRTPGDIWVKSFSAGNQYCYNNSPVHPLGNIPITALAWVNFSVNGARQIFLRLGAVVAHQSIFFEREGSLDHLFFHWADMGGVSSTGALTINTWYFCVAVYDGTNNHLYIDGVLNNSTAYAIANMGSGQLFLGDYGAGSGLGLRGYGNDFRIKFGAMNAYQIYNAFQNERGRYGK